MPDREFVRYIKEKEDSYDEGNDITVEQLMLRAADKYKRMVEVKEWKAPSAEQERIIALEAALKKLTNKPEQQPKPDSKNKNKSNAASTSKDKAKSGGKKNKRQKKPKAEWMLKPPAPGEKHTKTVDGGEYTWCAKHKSWGGHSTNKCEGRGLPKEPSTKEGSKDTDRKLTLTKAMQTVTQDEE